MQVSASREYYFDGKLLQKPGIDLLIAEYPDGLRVPGVSDPPSQIPHWNEYVDNFLKVTMGFAYAYLHDDGSFLLFYPDSPIVRKELMSYFKNYKMKIVDEWTIINYLHLANPLYPTKNVRFFNSLGFLYFILLLYYYLYLSYGILTLNILCRH